MVGSAVVDVVCVHSVDEDRARALSAIVDVRLWICPTAEISVVTVLALFCNRVGGCAGTAIKDEMMLFAWSPLPMPAELMEPVVVLVVVVMDLLAVLERTIGGSGAFLRSRRRAETF